MLLTNKMFQVHTLLATSVHSDHVQADLSLYGLPVSGFISVSRDSFVMGGVLISIQVLWSKICTNYAK